MAISVHTSLAARAAATTLLIASMASTAQASAIITNGDFQTGDLSGWSVYTTANGTIGTPTVDVFEVVAGSFNNAAQLRAGQVNFGGPASGGGIFQSFNLLAGGEYSFSADIASESRDPLRLNAQGGIFNLMIDGVTVSTYAFNDINSGITLRSSLSYTGILSAGLHELRIEALRPYLTSSITPMQYIDNVTVAAVPEADSTALLLAGLAVVGLQFARRRAA